MSTKTTELIVFVGAVIAVVITALVVGGDDKGNPTHSGLLWPCATSRG